MHRALLLSEIIATILRAEISSPGFLYTCLFINSAFSIEATRILWDGCGARYNSAAAGHVAPDIKDLARIVLQDPRRAQYYANFIRILMFHDEGEANDFIDEARWHRELAAIQFPMLEEVGLFESDNATSLNTGDAITHYAQPNVKYFTLRQGSLLSDSFLDTLHRSCPKLKSLTLNGTSDNTVSEDGLVRFLEGTNSLESLDFRTGLDGSWSCKALHIITGYRNLKLLSIPDIQDDWIDSLRHASPIYPAFPNLKYFFTGTSDQGLEFLALYAPNLDTLSLDLQNLPPSRYILASASKFTRLTSLAVHFSPQSTLTGHDLVVLTQKCPQLTDISIGEDEGSRPSGFGISDSVIDEVARNLPKLSQLILIFDNPGLLTWQSLLSFARHCKSLEMLKISCNVNWQEAVHGMQENIFSTLWSLEIVLDENNRDGKIADGSELDAFASRFAALVPKLTNFVIEGGNKTDESLEMAVGEICMARYQ